MPQPSYAPVITVKEARKLLGNDGVLLTDTQVGELITVLSLISRAYLKCNGS